MRVGLNATCFDERPSGANQRFREIYGALIRRNPQITFLIYEPLGQPIARWFAACANVQARPTPLPASGRIRRSLLGAAWWPAALRRDRLDLFESFHLPAVIAPDCPTLLTIHDLRPIHADASLVTRLIGRLVLRRALLQAATTIAVSDTVADEIRSFHPGAAVTTVYNGLSVTELAPAPPAQAAAARQSLGLPEDFILTVGHIEPRKNLSLLVEAVALLRTRGLVRPLAIIGNDGGAAAGLRAQIATLGLEDRVTIHSGVDHATLRGAYAACRLLAFPSRQEGFGIPLIEAMAAGKPIAASDISCFAEVGGAALLCFPVGDASAAAEVIETVWSDDAARASLIAAGTERRCLFTVDHLADQIAALYAKILAKPASAAARE